MYRVKINPLAILFILLLFVSIGYAFLSTNLNITGTSTINNPIWDIHFTNIHVKSGSVTPDIAATINDNGDGITYEVTLDAPGDFYEFTVDVVNAGTLDGEIESITSTINSQPISSLPNYLEYYVTYSDGIEIAANHLLAAGDSETYVVHIGYKDDILPEDLPDSDNDFNLYIGIVDKQKTPDAVPKPAPLYTYYAVNDVSNQVILGGGIPSTVTVSDTYQIALESFSAPFFLKYVTRKGIVEEAYIGFVYNNNVYYLRGGGATYNAEAGYNNDDSPYYQENKELLYNTFGNKCTDGGNDFSCIITKENYYIFAAKNGYVGIMNANAARCDIAYHINEAYCEYGL